MLGSMVWWGAFQRLSVNVLACAAKCVSGVWNSDTTRGIWYGFQLHLSLDMSYYRLINLTVRGVYTSVLVHLLTMVWVLCCRILYYSIPTWKSINGLLLKELVMHHLIFSF